MGAELAKAVAARGGHLSGNAFKVLTRMAWTALDKPNEKGQPARLYFAGWGPLALALGKDPDGPSAKQVQKSVSVALTELFEYHAFDRLVEHAHAGTAQRYRLTPEAIRSQRDETRPGRRSTPKTGVHMHPESRGALHPDNPAAVHPDNPAESTPITGVPRKEQDQRHDLPQDDNTHATASVTDRAGETDNRGIGITAGQPHEFAPDDSGLYCDACGLEQQHQRHDVWRASA